MMTVAENAPTLWMVWPQQHLEIDLKPLQGLWTEQLYLKLTDQTNQLIEFTDGEIEVLPRPTRKHQVILALLYELFVATVRPQGGLVLFSALRMQIRPAKYREPDLLLLLDRNDIRNQDAFWLGADLVVEIVSPDDPERDTITKRADYAEANIPEYWIVNPLDQTITVLTLADDRYIEHGLFQRGSQASSQLLTGFSVDVDAIFDAQ
ncbi:MAG: Uma2 family endonuclease [Roseiflexaceae bacterium]|nr:Uma2 family endonuclease [Roseiflexaceae bacterium]